MVRIDPAGRAAGSGGVVALARRPREVGANDHNRYQGAIGRERSEVWADGVRLRVASRLDGLVVANPSDLRDGRRPGRGAIATARARSIWTRALQR